MMDVLANGNGWLIAGLILIIIEMVLNLGYVSISFGVGAITTGLLIKAGWIPPVIDTGMIDELLIASIISVISLMVLRFVFNRKASTDINEY